MQPVQPVQPVPSRPARGSHGRGSGADMIRSMIVVIGVVAVFIALTPRTDGVAVRVVDVAGPLSQARASAPYDVLSPDLAGPGRLGPGWRAASAGSSTDRHGALTWRVGFLTPSDAHAALVQSDEPAQAFLADVSAQGAPAGTQVAGEQEWQRLYQEAEDQRTLWRAAEGSTVVVTGTASWDELAELAGSLRVAPAGSSGGASAGSAAGSADGG